MEMLVRMVVTQTIVIEQAPLNYCCSPTKKEEKPYKL